MMTEKDDKQEERTSIHVDAQHISAGGNITFAGRDANITIQTQGDVAQANTQQITVGGVKTTPRAKATLIDKLKHLRESIQQSDINDDDSHEADTHISVLERELTGERKPNSNLIKFAFDRLADMSPLISKSLLDLFSDSLVNEMLMMAGDSAISVIEKIRKLRG